MSEERSFVVVEREHPECVVKSILDTFHNEDCFTEQP